MPDDAPSYEADIKPLFRELDRESMDFAFDLWSYDDVKAHATEIQERIEDGGMPCDGPWPPEQVELLKHWVEAGSPP